jgi:hypothetical protein
VASSWASVHDDTDLNAALVEQFLDIAVTQWEAVTEPDGVLDDRHRESVALGFRVGHGGLAYPGPVKATQPRQDLDQGVLAAPGLSAQ